MAPRRHDNADVIAGSLRTALLRESIALVDSGTATPWDVDTVVKTTIGRRLSVAGPFAIWEQIGWDLVQVIAGELLKDISNAVEMPSSLVSILNQAENEGPSRVLADGADPAGAISHVAVVGAGLMGHGIALELAASGRSVRLHDLSPDLLADAMARAHVGLRALARTGRISDADADASLGRISTTTALAVVERGIATASEVDELVSSTFGKALSSAGPFELARSAGLDATRALLAENLLKLSNNRQVPGLLIEKVESGELGVRAGKGFYDWTPESAEAWRMHMADSLLDMATDES
jgi:3-hydroxyacyl-CoA dehydrogenase